MQPTRIRQFLSEEMLIWMASFCNINIIRSTIDNRILNNEAIIEAWIEFIENDVMPLTSPEDGFIYIPSNLKNYLFPGRLRNRIKKIYEYGLEGYLAHRRASKYHYNFIQDALEREDKNSSNPVQDDSDGTVRIVLQRMPRRWN